MVVTAWALSVTDGTSYTLQAQLRRSAGGNNDDRGPLVAATRPPCCWWLASPAELPAHRAASGDRW